MPNATHPAGQIQHPNWQELPTVEARDPDDREAIIRLRLCPEYIEKNLDKCYRTPIYQCWAHLVGVIPNIPNRALAKDLDKVSLTTLRDAHACFQGVNRPFGETENGEQVFVYLIKVNTTIEFSSTPPCSTARAMPLDDDVLFVVLVNREDGLQENGEPIWGTILGVSCIVGDPADPLLTIDADGRYNERKW